MKIKNFFFMEFERLQALINHLASKELTIAFAESMTSGLLAAEFGKVPGVSDILLGGFVAYSADVKKKVLKVNKMLIKQNGPISSYVSRSMAEGVKELMDSKIAIGITGTAGSLLTKEEVSSSIGTTFICIIIKDQIFEFRENFQKNGGRNEIRQAAVDFVCEKLIELTEVKFLSEEEKEENMLLDMIKALESNKEYPRANKLREFLKKKYPNRK